MRNLSCEKRAGLHSLIPLDDFKALLGVDDRDDALARYCLLTATYTIEQHCMRRLLLKRHFERVAFEGDVVLPLREYPVREILAVYALPSGEIVEPDYYHTVPDCGLDDDLPFCLALSPALLRLPGLSGFKVVYAAGYSCGEVPADLASACLELAGWNWGRLRGKRFGLVGNVRGSGKDGEHYEASMPENVRFLLEPYRRKII